MVVLPLVVFSQFEQKFTLNFSIGLVNPYGESDYLESDIETDIFTGTYAQPYPYLMSNFGAGAIFTGGIQVNYNRRFSMYFNLQFFRIRKWYYGYEWNFMDSQSTVSGSWMEWEITQTDIDPNSPTDEVFESGENELTMINLGLAAMPKVYILPGRLINPYLFAEVGFNFTDLKLDNSYGAAKDEYGVESLETEPVEYVVEQSVGLGVYPGLGFDISVNENLGLFLQSGFSFIFINNGKLKDAGHAEENFKTFKIEAGIKVSFLRSKNL